MKVYLAIVNDSPRAVFTNRANAEEWCLTFIEDAVYEDFCYTLCAGVPDTLWYHNITSFNSYIYQTQLLRDSMAKYKHLTLEGFVLIYNIHCAYDIYVKEMDVIE